jgi:16S rRNA (guanine(1405)-N(7))-methyltransferase
MMLQSDEQAELERLVKEVLSSAHYRDICPSLVRSIGFQELGKRRNHKEALKSTKNKLHQVSGAYLNEHGLYPRWLHQFQQAALSNDRAMLQQACLSIMSHHASTRERLPIIDQFYTACMAELAPIHSILDIACGLNPLAIPWMPLAADANYYAYDVHQQMLAFLAHCMDILGVRGQAQAVDLVQHCPQQEADVALVLKTLPCLEQINKQAGYYILRALKARYLIVSFPVHSLGGKNKGMQAYYDAHFRELIDDEPWQVQRIELATELVFLVRK